MSENTGAMQAIDTAINMSVEKWFSAVCQAIDNVKPESAPGDNNAMFYAMAAAAGNMIWAASCLLEPEFAVPIRALSFGGAGLASAAGVMAAAPSGDAPSPTGPLVSAMKGRVKQAKDKLLSDAEIARLKVSLYRRILHEHPLWITHFGINDSNLRQAVWKHLFHSNYGAGIESAAENLRRIMEKSLKDFYSMVKERYQMYGQIVVAEVNRKYPSNPMAMPPAGGPDPWASVRSQAIKDRMTPNEFNHWLNTEPASVAKFRVFKDQHMIIF